MMVGLHFLYKVMKDNRGDLLLQVPPRWFLISEERKEYRRLLKFMSKYGKLPQPPDTIPPDYTDEIPEYYIDALKLRYIKHLFGILKTKEVDEDNAEKLLRFIYDEAVNLYTRNTTSEGIVTYDRLSEASITVANTIRMNKISGILGYPTGYQITDKYIGGAVRGEVIVVVARMKLGKTMYLLNMAKNMAKDHRVMFISMEMPIRSVIKRLLALQFGTPNFISLKRIPSTFLDREIKNLNLKLDIINGSLIQDISDIYSLINVYKPAIVIIDGAYLLPFKDYKSEWEKAKNIIETLRKLALTTDVALLCSWQLSREAVKRKKDDTGVEVHHIAYTDAVAQSATAVIAITEDAKESKAMRRFLLLCNREGESGVSIGVWWNWATMDFTESEIVEEVGDLNEDWKNLLDEALEEGEDL